MSRSFYTPIRPFLAEGLIRESIAFVHGVLGPDIVLLAAGRSNIGAFPAEPDDYIEVPDICLLVGALTGDSPLREAFATRLEQRRLIDALLIDCFCRKESWRLKFARILFRLGANPDTTPDGQDYLLHHAVLAGDLDFACMLLDQGATVDRFVPGESDWTPLMLACRIGDPRAVALLIDRGANVLFRNGSGESALTLALEGGNADVLRVLERASS